MMSFTLAPSGTFALSQLAFALEARAQPLGAVAVAMAGLLAEDGEGEAPRAPATHCARAPVCARERDVRRHF